MDREKSLDLYKKGKEAWNQWAQGCVESREKSKEWRAKARVDLAHVTLSNVDFSGWVFPGDTDFSRSHFDGKANFAEASFQGTARFHSTNFRHEVSFRTAEFQNAASFLGTEFARDADFADATFHSEANFSRGRFVGPAFFHRARFCDPASFEDAHFLMRATYSGATFERDANFQRSEFKGLADFERAHFRGAANFNAINAASAFDLGASRFDELPNFVQAHFVEAPRLDNVEVPVISEWQSLRGHPDPEAAPRYRALKRLAIQAHDHDREHRFFADEIRSLRGHPDKAFPRLRNLFRKSESVWQGGARYWFGLLYEVFSDFGRSIVRPLVLLVLAIILFAELYFGRHYWVNSSSSCIEGKGNAIRAAIYLAVRKGLIFPGLLGQDQKLDQAYTCLYGTISAGSANGSAPLIPESVAYLAILQTLVSVVLIFLFLLAIRNHFRIK